MKSVDDAPLKFPWVCDRMTILRGYHPTTGCLLSVRYDERNVQTIPVRTPSASYNVLLGAGLLPALTRYLDPVFGAGARRFFVITSPEIQALWGESLQASFAGRPAPAVLLVPAGEQHKRVATVERLCEELAQAGADRGSVVIALGGGVIGDIAGFVAAIYMRGMDYVQVPTTVLAQVDSSVGGKTGVNLAAGKNLVGAFHHPRLVVADIDLLRTLPEREMRAGLFESVKAGLICDPELFAFMESHRDAVLQRQPEALTRVLSDSVRVKAEVVGADERESGLRMILNFGHTAAHALEAATGYTGVLHGEAVAWGMLVALEVSRRRGLLSDAEAARALAVVRAYGAPRLPEGLSPGLLLERMAGDKKNIGGIRRYVLLRELGKAFVATDVTDAELIGAMEWALSGKAL